MTDQEWILWLRALATKIDGIAMEVAVQDGFLELESIIDAKINELGGKVNPPRREVAPLDHQTLDQKLFEIYHAIGHKNLTSVLSELEKYKVLFAIAYFLDRAGAAIIFLDPHHTISYNIAIRARDGDPIAIEMCQALNTLSPDHCAWALSNESLCRTALGAFPMSQ